MEQTEMFWKMPEIISPNFEFYDRMSLLSTNWQQEYSKNQIGIINRPNRNRLTMKHFKGASSQLMRDPAVKTFELKIINPWLTVFSMPKTQSVI